MDLSEHPRAQQIETFFTTNVINNTAYVTAVQQMRDPSSHFWHKPTKIPILTPISPSDRKERWSKSVDLLEKGDVIFTFDKSSAISRLIVYFDQGTWSHTATYVGDGRVIEAVGEGVVERDIEVYNRPSYRLGVYRLPEADPHKIDALVDFLRAHIGDRYSYRKVLILGLRLVLGMWPTGAARHTTPNMTIIRARFDLVSTV